MAGGRYQLVQLLHRAAANNNNWWESYDLHYIIALSIIIIIDSLNYLWAWLPVDYRKQARDSKWPPGERYYFCDFIFTLSYYLIGSGGCNITMNIPENLNRLKDDEEWATWGYIPVREGSPSQPRSWDTYWDYQSLNINKKSWTTWY